MHKQFEPVDYTSLMQKNIELEAALSKKAALARSVIAENAGLLLAVDDAIAHVIKFATQRGIPADQAEMLPAIKALRTAVNVPATIEVLKTLIGMPGMLDQIAPKGDGVAETQLAVSN